MANPDKPVFIPQPRKDKDVNKAPEFNHNIMGRLVSKDAGNIHCIIVDLTVVDIDTLALGDYIMFQCFIYNNVTIPF